jgi:hypothetical protein
MAQTPPECNILVERSNNPPRPSGVDFLFPAKHDEIPSGKGESPQRVATAFVGRAATSDRGAASGFYLACYFCGGLIGTAILGFVFDRFGWTACIACIGSALAVAALLTARLTGAGSSA